MGRPGRRPLVLGGGNVVAVSGVSAGLAFGGLPLLGLGVSVGSFEGSAASREMDGRSTGLRGSYAGCRGESGALGVDAVALGVHLVALPVRSRGRPDEAGV